METATQTITPEVGMSVTYYIGSDAYHEIIVDITRNWRSVLTLDARKVLGGVSLADWNSVPQLVREIRARDTWIELIAGIVDNADDESDAMLTIDRIRNQSTFTLRKDGTFVSKGDKYGYLKLNSQYQYSDPTF